MKGMTHRISPSRSDLSSIMAIASPIIKVWRKYRRKFWNDFIFINVIRKYCILLVRT